MIPPINSIGAATPRCEEGLLTIPSKTGRDSVVQTIFPDIARILIELAQMQRNIAARLSVDPSKQITKEESQNASELIDTVAFLQRQMQIFHIRTRAQFPLSSSQNALWERVELAVANANHFFGLLPCKVFATTK